MKKKLLAIALVVLSLAGCSAISSGTITDKIHKDAYYTTSTYCSVYIKAQCAAYASRQDYHPESWRFDIEDGKNTGWVYVSEQSYSEFEVGDYVSTKD